MYDPFGGAAVDWLIMQGIENQGVAKADISPIPKRPRGAVRLRGSLPALGGMATVPVLLIALLLISPLAAGAVPNTTTLKAPFTKAVVTLTNPVSHAGSGVTSILVASFFNKTTGVGGFRDAASAVWRSHSGTNNSALATGRIQVNVPISITTTGAHTITAIWITIANGGVNLTAGKCSGNASVASTSCTRFAQSFVFGFGTLIDRTNGSTIRVQTWPGNSTSLWSNTTCAFKVCHTASSVGATSSLHTGKAFWSWSWSSVSLVSTHKYILEMFLFGGGEVTLSTNGATLSGASGNAQFNSGSTTADETLSSISIK